MEDPTIIAYLAGILDGEGSIGISSYEARDAARGKRGKYYQLFVTVGMQNKAPLDLFAEAFPGSFPVRQDTIYRISWSSKKAGEVLKDLLPYLHVKRPQAELGLLFQSQRKLRGRGYTFAERERDRKFHDLSQELNRRDAQGFYDQNGVNSEKIPLRYRKDNAERSDSGTTPELLAAEIKAEIALQPDLFWMEGESNV